MNKILKSSLMFGALVFSSSAALAGNWWDQTQEVLVAVLKPSLCVTVLTDKTLGLKTCGTVTGFEQRIFTDLKQQFYNGQCLDQSSPGSAGQGKPLTYKRCSATEKGQQWTFIRNPDDKFAYGSMKNDYDMCMNVSGGADYVKEGGKIIAWPCTKRADIPNRPNDMWARGTIFNKSDVNQNNAQQMADKYVGKVGTLIVPSGQIEFLTKDGSFLPVNLKDKDGTKPYVVLPGSAGFIAQGGGNIVGQGGGNFIAQGGGNLISINNSQFVRIKEGASIISSDGNSFK